jgi:hypothetical protein
MRFQDLTNIIKLWKSHAYCHSADFSYTICRVSFVVYFISVSLFNHLFYISGNNKGLLHIPISSSFLHSCQFHCFFFQHSQFMIMVELHMLSLDLIT